MATNQVSAQARGIVVVLEGKAWVLDTTGNRVLLKIGDEVQEGQVILTDSGTRMELALPNGQTIAVAADRELLIDANLLGLSSTDHTEAALKDLNSGSAEVVRVIQSGGDLFTELDPTAAGLTGGDNTESHSFVRVLRIVENLSPLALDRAASVVEDREPILGRSEGIVIATAPGNPGSSPNTAPTATDNSAGVIEDTPVSGNVLTDGIPDSDPDGNPLAVSGFSVAGIAGTFTPGASAVIPFVGTLTIASNGAYTFTPAINYNGPVPLATYTITDGLGGSNSATLTLGPVTATNDAPDARDDTNSVPINTTATGNVLSNDTDIDGNALSVIQFTVTGVPGTFAAGTPAAIAGVGTLQINADGTYSFSPAANYAGPVPVATYTITDGQAVPNTATATLTLTLGANTAPTATDNSADVIEDTPVSGNVLTDGIPDSDPDGNPLAVSGFSVAGIVGTFTPGASAVIPFVGTLTIASNGVYTFTPALNYNGPVPLATYTITDGLGGSNSATLTLGPVTATNDAAVITPAVLNLVESNAVLTTGGTLAITDVDSAATFV
ncbi:MAG: hypothetical protein RIS34_142, partial [Pseudomonadota bacterium]